MTSPLYASANARRVTSWDVLIPYYGAPVADIALDGADTLTGPVTLRIGNLSRVMGILRQRTFAGAATARLVGGAARWGAEVPARAYANPQGVKLSTVLADVAREVGETVQLAADRTVGQFYVREKGPAQRVLRQLAGEIWYVDALGRTQVGGREATTIKTEAAVDDYVGGKGWLTVATEDLAAWVPGATFAGNTVPSAITVSSTRIRSAGDGAMRLEVLTT